LENCNGFDAAVRHLSQAIAVARASSILPVEEYTFLFARQSPCPPYESAYIDAGRGHSLADVAGFYRAFGFQIAPDAHQLPDHIGSQLEFMALLCAKEAYALEHALSEQAKICQDARRTFLLEHLGFWTAIFAARVKSTARLSLYPALTELVRAVLTHESHELQVELPQLPDSELPLEAEEESEIQCAV
jgi:TorA maturation chaperone TorD